MTVLEIGNTKREIAFLGDTMNTSARIQGLCNRCVADLLISEEIYNSLNSDYHFNYKKIGQVKFRGKNSWICMTQHKLHNYE